MRLTVPLFVSGLQRRLLQRQRLVQPLRQQPGQQARRLEAARQVWGAAGGGGARRVARPVPLHPQHGQPRVWRQHRPRQAVPPHRALPVSPASSCRSPVVGHAVGPVLKTNCAVLSSSSRGPYSLTCLALVFFFLSFACWPRCQSGAQDKLGCPLQFQLWAVQLDLPCTGLLLLVVRLLAGVPFLSDFADFREK